MIEEQLAKLTNNVDDLGNRIQTVLDNQIIENLTTSINRLAAVLEAAEKQLRVTATISTPETEGVTFTEFVDQNVNKPDPVAPPEDLPQEKKRGRKPKASKTVEPPEEEVTADHKDESVVTAELPDEQITVDKAKNLAKDKLAAGVLRQKIRDIVVDLQGDDASIATLTPENLGKFYSRVSDL